MLPSFDMVVVDEVVTATMKFAFGLRFLLAPKRLSLSMTHQFLQRVKMIGNRKWLGTSFHPPTESFNVVDPAGTGAVLENTKHSTRTNLSVQGGGHNEKGGLRVVVASDVMLG